MTGRVLVISFLAEGSILPHFLFHGLFWSVSLNDSHILLDSVIWEIKHDFLLFVTFNGESNIFIVWCGIFLLQESHLGKHELFLRIGNLLIFHIKLRYGLVELLVLEVAFTLVFHWLLSDILWVKRLVFVLRPWFWSNCKGK